MDPLKQEVVETAKRAFRHGSMFHRALGNAMFNAYGVDETASTITIRLRTANGPRHFEIRVTEKL